MGDLVLGIEFVNLFKPKIFEYSHIVVAIFSIKKLVTCGILKFLVRKQTVGIVQYAKRGSYMIE